MIGYLEGTILRKGEERILLLAGQVGYDVLLPAFVRARLHEQAEGDPVTLFIAYQQTERQPLPVLIGFNSETEKEFFQQFISVEAIGPLKAVKALTIPISDIAEAIESGDVATLKNLKGIGIRTAQKIIATLGGKMGRFVQRREEHSKPTVHDALAEQVLTVLVEQLGHRLGEAREMIADAIQRNDAISTPEELFDEIYRGRQPGH